MRGQRSYALLRVGATAVLTAILAVGCGGDSAETPTTTTTTPVSTSLPGDQATTTAPTTTEPMSTATTIEPVTTSSTSPSTSVPSATVPEPSIPTGPIPDDEAGACAAIQERLEAFQAVATESGLDGLVTIQLGLEEFENEIDFISEQQEWGLLMLEQLVQVRREWSTAYSDHVSGDAASAKSHFEAAAGYMGAALAVPCP